MLPYNVSSENPSPYTGSYLYFWSGLVNNAAVWDKDKKFLTVKAKMDAYEVTLAS